MTDLVLDVGSPLAAFALGWATRGFIRFRSRRAMRHKHVWKVVEKTLDKDSYTMWVEYVCDCGQSKVVKL